MAAPEDSDNEDFAALFAESERSAPAGGAAGPAVGDLVTGSVISISAETVFVDLGGKSEGILDIGEVLDGDGNPTVSVGDTIRAHVVDGGERSGTVLLRRSLGKGSAAQSELETAYENGIPVEGVVTAVNKGGFEVQVAGIQAFCPVSQMDVRFVEDPEVFIGQRLDFRITRFEQGGRGRSNIVLSRRALLEEEIADRASLTRERLVVGEVFQGKVTKIEAYGAFVDIGGMEGMLHISELGYARVEHPSEVLRIEQGLEVQVLRIEKTDNPRRPEKISLSLRSLARDPWDDVETRLTVGQRFTGKVARIEQFGAFVEVVPGIEGLVHISEMGAGERLSSPRKVVSPGQEVEVLVMSIDTERRRVSLSMDAAARDARATDEREAMAAYGGSKERLGNLGDLMRKQLPGRDQKK
jgi:small subunit ribosomal protein S1